MRRPLSSELKAEDRLLAQRWAIAVASFYLTIVIVIVAGVLAGHPSTVDEVAVAAKSERTVSLQDRSGTRPDGLSSSAVVACAASQPCPGLKANRVGGAE